MQDYIYSYTQFNQDQKKIYTLSAKCEKSALSFTEMGYQITYKQSCHPP
jgi:hypothetical protein